MLPCRTYNHSASSVPAIHISCCVIAVFVFRKPLFTTIMSPKHNSSNAGSASKPKRSRDILSISEKVKILDMIEIEKNPMQRLPGCMARMKHTIFIVLSSLETVHDTVQYRYCILSLLYCLLRIMLKCQTPLLSYVREREYTVNVQCSVEYTILLLYLMLVMSYCV